MFGFRLLPSTSLVSDYAVVSRSGNAAGPSGYRLGASPARGLRRRGRYVVGGRTADGFAASSPVEGQLIRSRVGCAKGRGTR
jgi:hypothetical protein